MAEKQSELTPRKSVNRYLCRCCNKFTPSHDRPINLSGKKAKKERIRELILQFGHVKTIEGDGCGQIICTECYAKVTKIQKQVHSFREVCMSTEEAQKESRDRSSVVDVKILIVKKTFWSNLGKGIDIGIYYPSRNDKIR